MPDEQLTLTEELERLLGIKPKGRVEDWTYDEYVEYFRRVPRGRLVAKEAQTWLQNNLPIEGFAAVARWMEIVQNPSKMDKLHQTRLKAARVTGIKELAKSDDQAKFYEALIDQNVDMLETGELSAQEVARLTANINIFNKQLRDIRSRKPKEGSVLDRVLKLSVQPLRGSQNAKETALSTNKNLEDKTAKRGRKKCDKKPKTTAKNEKNDKTSKKEGEKDETKKQGERLTKTARRLPDPKIPDGSISQRHRERNPPAD